MELPICTTYCQKITDYGYRGRCIQNGWHVSTKKQAILKDFGVISKDDWDNWGHKNSLLRVFGNIKIPGIEVTSGSLGHCIGVGSGMAISFNRSKIDRKIYVIISEGELYEGSTWEALLLAKHYNLKNLSKYSENNSKKPN